MALVRETQLVDALTKHVVNELMEGKRKHEGLSPEEWDELNPRAEVYRDVMSMGVQFRMAWGRTTLHGTSRAITHLIDTDRLEDVDHYAKEIVFAMDNVRLKGELFLLRLSRHLPKAMQNQIARVECGPAGKLRVYFKNEQILETTETEIESDDFWATCGMVYDL